MFFVIKGRTTDEETFYGEKGRSHGKTVYRWTSKITDATTWRTESGAKNALPLVVLGNCVSAEVVSLTEKEYEETLEREAVQKRLNNFNRRAQQIEITGTAEEREIAAALKALKVGDRVLFYERKNKLDYQFIRVTAIDDTTFTAGSQRFDRLSGEGEQSGIALPDIPASAVLMSDRIIRDFRSPASAYQLTPGQRKAIAIILSSSN